MGRIQSSIGLITGIPIADTVNQLIQVAGRPRDNLASRTEALQSQRLAISTLSTRLLSLQFSFNNLKVNDIYNAREVTSSKPEVLTATLNTSGKPSVGSIDVRAVQAASAHQLVSQRFEDLENGLGTGSFSFSFGGFLDKGISLDELNSGSGVPRGQIRITDHSGASSVIDLSFARTVDDVLEAISKDLTVNVTAEAVGDSFRLFDNTGSTGTLSVQEVAGGATAAGLGLVGISTTAAEATGSAVFGLHTGTKLSKLNDGNGVRITDDLTDVDDLAITLANGNSYGVDLSGATTLGGVIDAINDSADLTGKISAAISADGNRLELTDQTTGAGTFTVANGVLGTVADDLGLTETVNGGVITGRRLVSGLKGTLSSSLHGGQAGTLGSIIILDRAGNDETIDLGSAETVDDLVALINASGIEVSARINDARNGITIEDTTGLSTDNLIISSADATDTAELLGIAVNAAVSSIDSGSLSRQTLSSATQLSSLHGGTGVTLGDITITDTNGVSKSADLNSLDAEAKTVGDVIDAINALAVGVTARINDTGDGILLIDTASGSGTLGVKDLNGTLAEDLNLTRASTTVDITGTPTQVIDGTRQYSVDLSELDGSSESITLASLNDGAGVAVGDFIIADSNGGKTAIDYNGSDAGIKTIGQLIDTINDRAANDGAQVTASFNSAGTGILLTDTAGGTEKLTVTDVNSTTAADLKIEGVAADTTIDGFGLLSIQSANQSALDKLASRINDLEAGVTASTIFDGVGFRLSVIADETGAANELLFDVIGSGGTGSVLTFDEVARAQDAVLVYGAQATPGSGVLISSATNDINQAINGVDLKIVTTSDDPVTVTVASSDTSLVEAVEDLVSSYNTLRDQLDELTIFNETDLTTGLLFGTTEALQVDTTLSRLVTDRYFGLGAFDSLDEIGLGIDDQGKLQLDKEQLREAFRDNPNGLKEFLTNEQSGVVAKFNGVIDRLAGADNGLLTNRNDALQSTIDTNAQRIDRLNDSLDRQRERLLLQFYQLEQVIAGLQQSQSALAALQPLSPLVGTVRDSR
jgi:flagellar hook-associated protein 2